MKKAQDCVLNIISRYNIYSYKVIHKIKKGLCKIDTNIQEYNITLRQLYPGVLSETISFFCYSNNDLKIALMFFCKQNSIETITIYHRLDTNRPVALNFYKEI